ncbi:hypothetical protein G9C85_02725 [Halorubellus sp. JP-L1]|uniref:DUF7344 domain-containing protein n=1 Tax=Halorubellus sp. JP-L1 TaxID=2715753 RepID=UPI001407923E|nr:hypothetical protein [Halorubellus sp. JP-L1]NHN40552.1 hypothetical protein [Halorubellus sp. JP-L1]
MTSLDQLFDLLSKERCRYALYYLEEQEGPVSVGDLAAQVGEWEADPGQVPITEEKFRDVKVELHHDSLPRVSEAEYVRYDADEGVVEITDEPPDFRAITSVAKVIERPDRNP